MGVAPLIHQKMSGKLAFGIGVLPRVALEGVSMATQQIPTFSRIASAFLRTQSSSNGNYMMKHVDLYRLSISAAAMSVGDFVAPKAGKHLGSNFWRIVSRSHSAGAAGAVAFRRAKPRGCLPPWTRRHRQLRVTVLPLLAAVLA